MHPAEFAKNAPLKVAAVMAGTGEQITYRELDEQSNASAWLLRACGLTRGDVVATLFANGLEVFIFGWAAQRSGLFLTAVSNKLTASDIAYILKDSGAKLLVFSDEFGDLVKAALLEHPGLKAFSWRGVGEGFPAWEAEAADLPRTPIQDESAGTDLLYSSGTTGRPKGVQPVLPDGPIGAATPLTQMGTALYGMGNDTVYLSTSPLYHAAPLRWAMAVQQLGGTVVVMRRFEAEDALGWIDQYRITHATFVPTHFVRILKLPEDERARYALTSLRAVIHAAAPCPVHVKQAMIEMLGPIVFEYYAGTENCGITAIDSHEWLARPGSVGKAVVGKVRILGESLEELPPGTVGQVFFSDGPQFAYLNDPQKTAEAHDHRGWATLGDIGRLDEEGYLYLSDRRSFMIISGGVNIYPQEIENFLIKHPAVADVAVIGVPDEEMGERVLAVVQTAPGVEADAALAQELVAFSRQGLGGVKTPRTIEFRDALPREPTGKLLKGKLKAEFAAKSQP